jgi:hypothetical protein
MLTALSGRCSRIQLSTDGHQTYVTSIPYIFDEIDWAQIHKVYKTQAVSPGRYSPPVCTARKSRCASAIPTQ